MSLPRELKQLIYFYEEKPSAILSQDESLLLPQAYSFWNRLAQERFQVLLPEEGLPYEQYLRLFTEAGGIDYGSEKYITPEEAIFRALKEQDIPLFQYFLSKVNKLGYEKLYWNIFLLNIAYSALEDGVFPQVFPILLAEGLPKEYLYRIRVFRALLERNKEKIALLAQDKRASHSLFVNLAERADYPNMEEIEQLLPLEDH